MATEFNRLGFRFLYPENWKLEVDETTGWPRSVSVYSPSGAMWSVTADSVPVEDLQERIADAICAEYEEVEREPIERLVGDAKLKGIELSFYCLDFLVVAQVLACPGTDRPTVILLQGESRDFEALGQVFDAISFSYLQARPN